MAYRSDLAAAHARLDAIDSDRPCPSCVRRAGLHRLFRSVVRELLIVMLLMAVVFGVLVLAVVATLVVFGAGFPAHA